MKRRAVTQVNGLTGQSNGASGTGGSGDAAVAGVGGGGTTLIDVPAGQTVLAASAWSYPGEFAVRLDATAGQTYTIEVAPRGDSFLPGTLLGPLGGAIDAGVNKNAGASQMRFVKE